MGREEKMLGVLAAPGEKLEFAAQPFHVLEHLKRPSHLHAGHNGKRTELPFVAGAAVQEHRLGEILADGPQRIVVTEEGLEFLPLVRLETEARNESALPDLVKLHHASRVEHLDEELVLGTRIPDADAFGRGVRDIHYGPDALSNDIVDVVELEVDRYLHRLGSDRKEE